MRIEVLGSGGVVPVPRPGYHDAYNDEAREKGVPYQRRCPGVFLHGPDILFDTPEDVGESLNRAGVDRVQACFYSHWHPDHVMGRRIFEVLNWDLRGDSNKVTDVYVPERVRVDMQEMLGTWAHLEYLQSLGVVKLHVIEPGASVEIDGYTITPEPLAEEYVFAYTVEQGDKRVWVAMDELVRFEPDESHRGFDLAVMPSGVCEFHSITGERLLRPDDPVLTSEMRYERTLEVVRSMSPKQAVFIHLDEPDGLTYDDGLELSRRLQADGLPIMMAWDGLIVEV